MNDDRVRRILQAADQPAAPAPEFASALLGELKDELGFRAATTYTESVGRSRPRAIPRAPSRRTDLLLAAALLVALGAGLLPAIGAFVNRAPPPPSNPLGDVLEAGRIRIAIRPDHPQFAMPGQSAAGFDIDIARAIATELGLSADVVLVEAPLMLEGRAGSWDIGLPSVPASLVDEDVFELSAPVYHWPHRLVVPETSAAGDVGDLAGQPICAVAGDAGQAWLAGNYGDARSSPVGGSIVTRQTDAECLELLDSGQAAGAVTATLSDAEIAVRAGIRVIGGPDPEPRVVVVPRSAGAVPGPSDLLRAVDEAIAALKNDGTLTQLSQSRFGGADLTVR
jgi:ABC-type amino acid transport substrate-binding protein